MEADVMEALPYSQFEDNTKKVLEWIVREYYRCITSFKDKLPSKAIRSDVPQVLWIIPPLHTNFEEIDNDCRKIFGDRLQRITSTYQGMTSLKLVKGWEYDDTKSYIKESKRFTSQGYNKYWSGIDSAVRYWCTAIWPKIAK